MKEYKTTYKISYPQMWDSEGTHYNQRIRVNVTERDAIRCNILSGRLLEKSDGPIFTKHHQRDNLCRLLGIKSKRLKDRNTVFEFSPA